MAQPLTINVMVMVSNTIRSGINFLALVRRQTVLLIYTQCLKSYTKSEQHEAKIIKNKIILFEASRGAGAQSVAVKPTGSGFDPRSRR